MILNPTKVFETNKCYDNNSNITNMVKVQ